MPSTPFLLLTVAILAYSQLQKEKVGRRRLSVIERVLRDSAGAVHGLFSQATELGLTFIPYQVGPWVRICAMQCDSSFQGGIAAACRVLSAISKSREI